MTKRKRLALILAIVMVFLASACTNASETAATEETTEQITETTTSQETTESVSDSDGAIVLEAGMVLNPLTGLPVKESVLENRPIAVMLDNMFLARPQAGLSEADVVYEILAEGLITRYMAIFYSQEPENIGPVRSARPYFIEKALEYDPYYVHVGGSMQALSDVKRYAMADIDGLSSGAFWRTSHKTIPHNMYTSSEVLLDEASRKGYKSTAVPEFLAFSDQFYVPEGDSAGTIECRYKPSSASDRTGYYTTYKYDSETHLYSRFTNGEPHVDENTSDQLTCSNIIVQYADTKVIDNEGRLDIDFIGTGTGHLYTAGKRIDLTWSKSDANSPTQFFDSNGTPILLNPGVTWFQVMKTGTEEQIVE